VLTFALAGLSCLNLAKTGLPVLCCSAVLSKRENSRPLDTAMKFILKPITWAFPTLLSIPATTMAQAMLNKTVTPATNKFEILENRDMHRVAAS